MRKTKEILVSMLVVGGILLSIPTISHGALQSNGDSPMTYLINRWIWEVRCMQEAGGTLGLTNTIDWNQEGGKYLTSDNPNLDIHMQKNTEYGAMAILSASSYGNPNVIQDGETTTGNETGIKMNYIGELVAAGQVLSATPHYVTAASRYKDAYTSDYIAKSGDAIAETAGWHGGGAKEWIYSSHNNKYNPTSANSYCALLRAYKEGNKPGTIFSYHGKGHSSTNASNPPVSYGPSYYTKPYTTRAVVVVGSGI